PQDRCLAGVFFFIQDALPYATGTLFKASPDSKSNINCLGIPSPGRFEKRPCRHCFIPGFAEGAKKSLSLQDKHNLIRIRQKESEDERPL
ncbi:MAG: hypothetical protein NC388_07445, partial [Clostridium sp.]|nr:hypothetical protein [Clostridium sp.]